MRCEENVLWSLSSRGVKTPLEVAPPTFEIDGRDVVAAVDAWKRAEARTVFPHVREEVHVGRLKNLAGASLKAVFRVADDSPVVRFRYELCADAGRSFRLTKKAGRDRLEYLAADVSAWPRRTEVKISEFRPDSYAYQLSERAVAEAEFENALPFMGPILAAEGDGSAAVFAYEHGSTFPDAFVAFCGQAPSRLAVRAVKGNYWRGEEVTSAKPYATIWFDAAVVPGGKDDAAAAFRSFLLKRCTPNAASRKPLVTYNTWALQERDYWWRGSRRYLNTINETNMLAEVEAAHEMGVELFEIDTGWFEKTGDWRVSRKRFPHGLEPISKKLKSCGMQLGLWFNPSVAATSSDALKRNRGSVSWCRGVASKPHEVWESEMSQDLCLASDYWQEIADEFIRLNRECGVVYFYLDGVCQYGCDAANHHHGDAAVPEEEREFCCAFEQPRHLAMIADRVCAACPDAIVDFDLTEPGRPMGLAFLASGKYFVSNNGPYVSGLDAPYDWEKPDRWSNVFVHPGPARARVVRTTLDADKWIPSVLYTSYYLPDAPRASQLVNFASLILGHNGIWGELRKVSSSDRTFFREALTAYKKVRDDMAAASPVRTGCVGGNPEIHEKLSNGGRGAVVMFACDWGEQTYVTRAKVAPVLWKGGDLSVETDAKGRAVIRARFPKGGGAAVVLFGE